MTDEIVHRDIVKSESAMRLSDIIEGCIQKDAKCQRALYDTYYEMIRSVSRRYLYVQSDIDDCMQNAFVRIFSKIAKFNEDLGSLKNWMIKVTINCARDMNKSRARTAHEISLEAMDHHVRPRAPEVNAHLTQEDVLQMLDRMPPHLNVVFNLYVVDGFSHKEISTLLDCTEAVSRQRLARARKWVSTNMNPLKYQ